jgi:hypothetical protein
METHIDGALLLDESGMFRPDCRVTPDPSGGPLFPSSTEDAVRVWSFLVCERSQP